MTERTPFVPADFDAADVDRVESIYRQLLERTIGSVADLEQWLQDASDLEAVIDELGSRRYIDHTCHTEDDAIEKAYFHFVEVMEPRLKPLNFELEQKLVASPFTAELEPGRYALLERSWRNAVELYREENIPLETEQSKLVTAYGKINGAMMVDYRGQPRTMQQLAKFLEESDRAVREEAWRLTTTRREQDKVEIEEIFSKLLVLREQLASNAGFDDYRSYTFRRRERFEYTPDDCLAFGDAIAELCLPLLETLDRKRQHTLGVERLRPWDLACDPEGQPALRPFEESEIEPFIEKTRAIFHRISPTLGRSFAQLQPGRNLDLESRPAKRPGGYQASLELSRQPFIFMNAVGTQRDVETLLHEGGHAIHYLEAVAEPLTFLRHAPLEFCEVASMSMELLGASALDEFYADGADARRAQRKLLEGIVRFLPWMATIDGYQHWIYTHPGHRPDERREAWLAIQGRFSSSVVDWSGLEAALPWRWHPQLHIFGMPFYYIEYGIAQLGALQVWLNYRRDPDRALADLRRAFALGGTRTLPALFERAGLQFDFTAETLAPLLGEVERELAKLA